MEEIETHPFKAFIPENVTTLIVGSFPGREVTHRVLNEEEWFYGSKRNQLWKIISGVYETALQTRTEKQNLFKKHGIGMVDIFLKVKRKDNNNMDSNLEVIEFNGKAIKSILKNQNIKKIFFTSKFVEKSFMKLFPDIKIGECLPSPSPRYARMNITEKINYYKSKLPK
ncbi:MAG TPA: uracil-DNA glycosylase family protein [Hanamia sp.]|nr:uracil-DNA glycosylase family protein [Hanamia sp.]